MTSEYERQADAAERELADMEQRSEQLEDQIDDARQDWEAKQADSKVPGAAGDPDRAEEGGDHPETAVIAKGPSDELSDPDPTDNDRGTDTAPDDAGEERPDAAGADEERGASADADGDDRG
jgi:hypothetical protein